MTQKTTLLTLTLLLLCFISAQKGTSVENQLKRQLLTF